jgi:DNA adenine methylase
LETGKLKSSNKSYDEIEIKPNSIIYCDIPYKDTSVYNNQEFDFNKFNNWCKKQTELLFISSYDMPEDFIPIAEFPHRSTLSATKNNPVIEKVFIPKHQLEFYKARLSACI